MATVLSKIYENICEALLTSQAAAISVDGKGGAKTVKALQKYLGVKQDGVISGQLKDLKKYHPGLTAVKYGKGGSPTVKAMQKWLGIAQDGQWGRNTSIALQKKLGVKQDGIAGAATFKALQKFLNGSQPAPAPTPTPTTNAQKIAAKANEFAYTTNTSKAKYPSGSPTAAYKAGLNKAYPNRSSWGKSPKLGASCDVFVGTCVRCAGVDPKFPRGLSFSYLPKSSKFKQVSVTKDTIQNGDIILYEKSKGGGHICIYYNGKIKEAGHDNFYPKTTDKVSARLSKSGKKWVKVFRAK